MIIWRCPNPTCKINNILQEDNHIVIDDLGNNHKVYEAQCGNCLNRYKIIFNMELKELKIEDK